MPKWMHTTDLPIPPKDAPSEVIHEWSDKYMEESRRVHRAMVALIHELETRRKMDVHQCGAACEWCQQVELALEVLENGLNEGARESLAELRAWARLGEAA